MRNEKEPRAIELALYSILAKKKRKKNDSLEGGVRKRAETEKSVEKKERTGGCGAPQIQFVHLSSTSRNLIAMRNMNTPE